MTTPAENEHTKPQHGKHSAPDDAERHPLIDLSRDPHPGIPDHARADDDDA